MSIQCDYEKGRLEFLICTETYKNNISIYSWNVTLRFDTFGFKTQPRQVPFRFLDLLQGTVECFSDLFNLSRTYFLQFRSCLFAVVER